MWLQAPNIGCVHGFSTRYGGLSLTPFDSLNLGGSEDATNLIEKNRELALQKLQLSDHALCFLKQVHGNTVCLAKQGRQEGDALVSNQKHMVLAISIADCYPILFYDEANAVIGAAHAGWRGTVSRIAANTINSMLQLGANPQSINVAIGQGICQSNFTVGNEVIEQFEKAGFPSHCWQNNQIDLVKCNRFVLAENNIPESNVWAMNRCTFEKDFFSYRRDKGITGRMWGLISMQ
ncbi:MAG: peptidoglycan editing factor PgeF [Bacteroidia bacterium]|nr:peptidoglycan editing factor PgeF [Bacteroidia bacterium]